MCGDCCTYYELHPNIISKLGLSGRHMASITDAWYLYNTVYPCPLCKVEDEDSEQILNLWFVKKQEMWNGDKVLLRGEMWKRVEDFHDDKWEVTNSMIVNGYRVFRILENE